MKKKKQKRKKLFYGMRHTFNHTIAVCQHKSVVV